MRTLLWPPVAFLLTACGGLTSGSVVQVAFPPPPSLTAPCATPVVLPERALSDRDIEIFWGRDRSALRACGSAHDGLVKWAQQ